MQIDIIQNGRVLRTIEHEGQTYVETPLSGNYKLRVTNNCHRRRLAVISVDGIDICTGEDASYDGGGYCLMPWQTIDIPGFHRDNGTVAAFEFKEQGGSYSAKMGKGTKNVGVIGLAVFDEKVVRRVVPPPVVIHEHHHYDGTLRERGGGLSGMGFNSPDWSAKGTSTGDAPTPDQPVTCNTADVGTSFGEELGIPCAAAGAAGADDVQYERERGLMPEAAPIGEQNTKARYDAYKKGDYNPRGGVTRSRRRVTKSRPAQDVGTGYGHATTFATTEIKFTRATTEPVLVVALRYATRARLESWGVPVEKPNTGSQAANPFPASQPSCPAPPGWRG
jgi:hypothetical protein